MESPPETALEWARSSVEEAPYAASLGARMLSLESERARLALPYRDDNSNGDKALHGGVAASLVDLGGQAVARAALGPASGPWHTTALQVAYLAAALGEEVEAEARLLRRGKELVFVEVEVRSESGKHVARGLVSVRGRFGAPPPELPAAAGDAGVEDPGPMGRFIQRVPFHAKLGLTVELMAGGRSRIVLPWREAHGDGAGGVHEGAALALFDTTGAMAAWAKTGPGRFKVSTPGVQVRFLAPVAQGDLVGYGHVLHHDREALFSQVEIARRSDGRLVAHGTVNYRIVTPELAR
jgi:uncharacterized protein (TIGR00369 family)